MIIIRNLCKKINRSTLMNSFDLDQFSYSKSKKDKSTLVKNQQMSKGSFQEAEKGDKPTKKKSRKNLVFEDNIAVFNKILEWRKHN